MRSKSNFTFLYSIVAPFLIFALAAAFPGCKESPGKTVGLEFWGVFDDSDVYSPLIESFNKQYPNIKIRYTKKNYLDYEKDLLEAMAAGRGPDLLMLHNTWLPKYQDKISAVAEDLITLKEFKETFVDVAAADFVKDSDIYALPLYVDTLALYYNKDILNTAGIPEAPKTWEEFLETVEKTTLKDERGNVSRAGAAIGTARNINRSIDILSVLMLQSGVSMINQNRTAAAFGERVSLEGEEFFPGERALQFYTDFANPLKSVYTWNTRMHYSIDAFYEGQAAMMFNYSHHFSTIRAKSPYLNFAAAPLPQIKTSAIDVNYANYWGLAVSKNSKNAKQAWQFISWLSQKENSRKYLETTRKPAARRDLISEQKNDPDLGVFARQALTARSWYQVDNSAIETIMAEMIESVVLGETTIKEAVEKATAQVTVLMKD
ncbi:MAG: hypothetical protein A3I88_00100 [Candidatus Portnoybacteria bacterium RIFCSPLOWO2_12_FULL_39_9]|uniref:ABC transporter substrate-binding protein n=1 Tax=Candidatus Portnoybacteria bacterium RIFCSPHIGHO2_12_FULL_38_9 TaxID=1801997 RepID=A0A1G2FJ12_9BACT|nr:MAG: hypothetical protein A2646_00750 [Candidatus Portnoybacteria bacterium RIFCSPHIGHO2_02_FULL_39_12]OGZ37640.1 MAG: hypothetical protein A3J64_00060 [Candidatus Portnoybacteria bacterium RIFCSPHIGHO2_12_FULL_38_9]OGZ39653.1 MAG: hypothetical protein A3I88_00100 [Candidatus Portnoybacteria bacterium RIFCSPLOWO2_12_FULL_39_9]